MRTVICHYHIYKNSGTSFDALLSENYGDQHLCFDGPFPFFTIDQEQFLRIIERKQNIIAFSSHQTQLPVPASLDFHVLPVVFVRHPLLRIQSVYRFKRQEYDGTLTSENAQKMEFEEWLLHCFSDRQEITHVSNVQTRILGAAYRQRPLIRRGAVAMEYDIQQALRNIESVTLLARTEFFNDDVRRFPEVLKKYDINFEFKKAVPANVTTNNHYMSIDERLDEFKNSLSVGVYERLVTANKQDLQLFDYASFLIEGAKSSSDFSSVFGG